MYFLFLKCLQLKIISIKTGIFWRSLFSYPSTYRCFFIIWEERSVLQVWYTSKGKRVGQTPEELIYLVLAKMEKAVLKNKSQLSKYEHPIDFSKQFINPAVSHLATRKGPGRTCTQWKAFMGRMMGAIKKRKERIIFWETGSQRVFIMQIASSFYEWGVGVEKGSI